MLVISDFRLTGREGSSIPSRRSLRSSCTALRIRGTKTAAKTPVTTKERQGSKIPTAPSMPPTSEPIMRNHNSPQATSRLRFGGIPSSESGGQDCHSYFLLFSAELPAMSTLYAQGVPLHIVGWERVSDARGQRGSLTHRFCPSEGCATGTEPRSLRRPAGQYVADVWGPCHAPASTRLVATTKTESL